MRQRRLRPRPIRATRLPRKRIWAQQRGSKGAANLARALGIKVLKHEGSTFIARPTDMVVNWGDSSVGRRFQCRVVNPSLTTCTNKLVFFRAMAAAGTPPRCPEFGTTRDWVLDQLGRGRSVCARTILTGHSGAGIIIVRPGDEQRIPHAPLYTRYIPKEQEYRVHIFRGEVIDIQRKIRDPHREPTNWEVRSHTNGFIYVRGGIAPNPDIIIQANLAFLSSGLDFGAVDVIWNAKRQLAYVLEINTAPGITGRTVEGYANAFRRYFQQQG